MTDTDTTLMDTYLKEIDNIIEDLNTQVMIHQGRELAFYIMMQGMLTRKQEN